MKKPQKKMIRGTGRVGPLTVALVTYSIFRTVSPWTHRDVDWNPKPLRWNVVWEN
jgi:hypothetical protein